MTESFPHVALFLVFGDAVILGSNAPIEVPWDELARRFDEPAVRADFADIGIDGPAALLAFLLADSEPLRAYVADVAEPNRDDRNWLERRLPHDLNRSERENLAARLTRRFATTRVGTLERTVPGLPLLEVLRVGVQPDHPMRVAAAPALADGLIEHFRRAGRPDRVALVRRWQREHARDVAPHLTKAHYEQLVRRARDAERRGDLAAAESLYREVLGFGAQPAYYTSGVALADVLMRDGRPAEAAALAHELQRGFPAHAGAYAREIRALEAAGREREVCPVVARARLYGVPLGGRASARCPGSRG
jgi:hypothetical protein